MIQVLEEQINPAIASHGGYAELVAVEDSIAYLRMGGGCQGCGMAAVTLSQGIEVAILDTVPEISEVVDVTDHASGDNPYYEAAKKYDAGSEARRVFGGVLRDRVVGARVLLHRRDDVGQLRGRDRARHLGG